MEIINRHLPHGGGKQTPNLIVVHAMGYQIEWDGELLYAATFLDRIGLSAHLLVSLDGTLIRCREDDEVAWHAKGHNLNSLGIEFLVPDAFNLTQLHDKISKPYLNNKQFESGVDAVRQWMKIWDIPVDRVKGHDEVDPERKFDPGDGFCWPEFRRRIRTYE